MNDLARNLDTYGDGEETPREPDDRDDAFLAILRVIKRHQGPLDYFDWMDLIDRLIDVADRNIDVTDPAIYLPHAELPEPS